MFFIYTPTSGIPYAPNSITVPEGNYNIIQLADKVKALLQSIILSAYSDTVALTMAYSKETGKVTITFTSGPANSSIELLYASGPTVPEMMGFSSAVTIPVGTSVVSSRNVNVNPINTVIVRSDSLNQAGDKESLIEKDVTSDILAEILITTNPGSFILQTQLDPPTRLTNRIIDKIQLYLGTNENYVLDLGGLDWQCMLRFDEIEQIVTTGLEDTIASSVVNQTRLAQLQKSIDDAEEDNRRREEALRKLNEEKKKLIDNIRKQKNEGDGRPTAERDALERSQEA